jgi:hypothetical protein
MRIESKLLMSITFAPSVFVDVVGRVVRFA